MQQQQLSQTSSLGFDMPVPRNGYRWWYLDGFSDCGKRGVTVIFFIGTVFSPYYVSARKRGLVDPKDFVCVNAVFYEQGKKYWSMTERAACDLSRSDHSLKIGKSSMKFNGKTLEIDLTERSAPLRRRIEGKLLLEVPAKTDSCFALHSSGKHRWWPISPSSRVEVDLNRPEISWSGAAYLDTNAGTVPLEETFSNWHWSRANLGTSNCRIVYEARAKDGETCIISLHGNACDGLALEHPAPRRDLPQGPIWRVSRPSRSYQGFTVNRILEDTPFYTRSHLNDATGNCVMHESLDLERFTAPWVQRLLPFRMRKIRDGLAKGRDPSVALPLSKGLE